jgi:hypothetical protein
MTQLFSFLMLAITVLIGSQARASNPELVNVALTKAYLPIGFDDNDRAQAVVAGTFVSGCYKTGPSSISVDYEKKTVLIRQQAYYYKGNCIQVAIPFSQTVNLGILREGGYSIIDATSGSTIGKLPVARATVDTPDDFLYAPVSDAYIREEDGERFLYFNGQFPTRCMRLAEVKVHYYSESIVVQPIAETLGTIPSLDCAAEPVRFQHRILLKEGLAGTYLLHVRVTNGEAINKLVQLVW